MGLSAGNLTIKRMHGHYYSQRRCIYRGVRSLNSCRRELYNAGIRLRATSSGAAPPRADCFWPALSGAPPSRARPARASPGSVRPRAPSITTPYRTNSFWLPGRFGYWGVYILGGCQSSSLGRFKGVCRIY